jgi:hypothetical protein
VTRSPGGYAGADVADVDALVTDRYLESILAAHARGADREPTLSEVTPSPDLQRIVEQLVRSLPRLHPSFRFEEALAARLNEAAARMHLPLAAGGESVTIPIYPDPLTAGLDDQGEDGFDGADPRIALGRPLLIGGALTSAALSLAGAAYLAWRSRHPQPGPMARAVRAVARGKLS